MMATTQEQPVTHSASLVYMTHPFAFASHSQAPGKAQVLLSELSPLALWLFNTRNLSTTTTARFITLLLHVGPDSRAEHNAKHLLSLAVSQMPARQAASGEGAVAETVAQKQLSRFWAGIKAAGPRSGEPSPDISQYACVHDWTWLLVVFCIVGARWNLHFERCPLNYRPELAGRWISDLFHKDKEDLNVCFPEIDRALQMLFAAMLHHQVRKREEGGGRLWHPRADCVCVPRQ